MVLRYEVLHARRQKLHLVDLPEAEMLAHGARQNQTRSENATDYSDRLLEIGRRCLATTSPPRRFIASVLNGCAKWHRELVGARAWDGESPAPAHYATPVTARAPP